MTLKIFSFVALALAALALVWVGVSSASEKDFEDPILRWRPSDFPLQVYATQYSAEGPQVLEAWRHTSLEDAIDTVNARLGFTAFARTPDGLLPHVRVTMGVPYNSAWDHSTTYSRMEWLDDHYVQCEMKTSNAGTMTTLGWALQHELGHCLGLAHDDFPMSIMHPRDDWRVDLRAYPWITDHDRGALRDAYMR